MLQGKEEYLKLLRYLEYTLHELPVGILYGANGANEEQCIELMKDTYRLEELAKDAGRNISEFIAFCRWHYERYPHYLSRCKHFSSYEHYMKKYNAPSKVST